MYRRNLERKPIRLELHVVADKPRRPLIQAVDRTILLAGPIAFYLDLYAQFRAAGIERSQPDSIHARGLLGGYECALATKHQRHFLSLRPASVQRRAVGRYRAVPRAANARNVEGQRLFLQAEVGAGQAHRALIQAIQGSRGHSACARGQVQFEMKGAQHARVVAADSRGLRESSPGADKQRQPTKSHRPLLLMAESSGRSILSSPLS